MRVFLLSALMLMFGLQTVRATDPLQLVFRTVDDSEQSIGATGLKMTVSEGKLSASNAAETLSFELTDLDRMYFSGQTVGLQEAIAAAGDSPVTLYSVSGVEYGRFSTLAEAASTATPGVYVVVMSDKSFKLQIK